MSGFCRNKKRAFTLTELLIALAVIGILVAILVPIARKAMPNQDTLMAKRGFFMAQNAVSNVINNYDCYPDKSKLLDTNAVRIGFDDGKGTSKCSKWSSSSSDNPARKFATLFTDQLDLEGSVNYTQGGATFRTKDGMTWEISHADNFNTYKNNKYAFAVISVDVNGTSKGPNCGQYKAIKCSTVRLDYDKFAMRVFENGKIQLLDCWAVDSVRSDKSITETTYRNMANCAELGAYPTVPTEPTEPTTPTQDVCATRPEAPTDPTDECCDTGLHPNSIWASTVYCDSCYPAVESKKGLACCNKWYNSPSEYKTTSDTVKDYCCSLNDFYNSNAGNDICPACRTVNETTLKCCKFKKEHGQITNYNDECCTKHAEIYNTVDACKQPTTPTTPTEPPEPVACNKNGSSDPSKWEFSEACCLEYEYQEYQEDKYGGPLPDYPGPVSPCCNFYSFRQKFNSDMCCLNEDPNPSYYCCNMASSDYCEEKYCTQTEFGDIKYYGTPYCTNSGNSLSANQYCDVGYSGSIPAQYKKNITLLVNYRDTEGWWSDGRANTYERSGKSRVTLHTCDTSDHDSSNNSVSFYFGNELFSYNHSYGMCVAGSNPPFKINWLKMNYGTCSETIPAGSSKKLLLNDCLGIPVRTLTPEEQSRKQQCETNIRNDLESSTEPDGYYIKK